MQTEIQSKIKKKKKRRESQKSDIMKIFMKCERWKEQVKMTRSVSDHDLLIYSRWICLLLYGTLDQIHT